MHLPFGHKLLKNMKTASFNIDFYLTDYGLHRFPVDTALSALYQLLADYPLS